MRKNKGIKLYILFLKKKKARLGSSYVVNFETENTFFSAAFHGKPWNSNLLWFPNDNMILHKVTTQTYAAYASVFKVCLLSLKPWASKCSIKFLWNSLLCNGDGRYPFIWMIVERERKRRELLNVWVVQIKNFGCFSKLPVLWDSGWLLLLM